MRDRSVLRRLRVALFASLVAMLWFAGGVRAAEFGTGPWLKGYSDILGGIVPPQPGLYVRADAYHYEGEVDATIFNGQIALGVEQDPDSARTALARARAQWERKLL